MSLTEQVLKECYQQEHWPADSKASGPAPEVEVGLLEVLVSLVTVLGDLQVEKKQVEVRVSVWTAKVSVQGGVAAHYKAAAKVLGVGAEALEASGFDKDWVLRFWAAKEEPEAGWGILGCVGQSL